MKKTIRQMALVLLALALFSHIIIAQEEATGLPGDNFSLDGALELLENSKDLESFEKALNKENNKVNNLDLNEDGEIDYVRVIDNLQGDAHAIVLQVPLNDKEAQDIAVIEIEKDGPESAILQIIGDEDIYGEQMIVEPYEEEGSGGKGGPDAEYDIARVIVNVWLWPSVRYVYTPGYVRYVSPWRWLYYPTWWRPWRPLAWTVWRPYRIYRPHRYRITTTHRVVVAHRAYAPVRTRSVAVRTRTTKVLTTNGNRTVAKSYTNTKVAAKSGDKKIVANKRTGKVAATKGDKKMVANKRTGKAAMTDGDKKAAINKRSGKVAVSDGDKKMAASKKSGKVAATKNGKKRVSSTTKARKKAGTKAKSANRGAKKSVKKTRKRKKG
ncbi:MAG: hypothetical protein KJP00_05235 [Bacteroidia bacterium]|nr:hypothetical protein [Bacteroidia bacterium]